MINKQTKQLHKIYTDGSCLKNPDGPGGYAFAIIENNKLETIGYGSQPNTTNNRMELQAVIEALKFVKRNEYELYTDSQLTIKCATGEWRRKSNLDLWREYDNVIQGCKIHWKWVRAHNGNKYNELVDDIAREAATQSTLST